MAFDLIPGYATEGHAMIKGDVVTDFSCFTDDHAHTVVDKEFLAYFCTRMNFNSGQETTGVGGKPTKEVELMGPEPVSDTIEPNCVQAWIAEDNLEDTT